MRDLPNALITGASAGIGRELASLFAADAHHVVLVARREERLREIAAELESSFGRAATYIVADLAAPGAARSLVGELERRRVEIDTLVNNAGFGYMGAFLDERPEDVEEMIRLNVGALSALTRLLLPGMLARGRGRVLNVASTAAFQPGPGMAVYYATKSYVLSFSEALFEELRGTGVSVTALCPGPTPTEFQAVSGMQGSRIMQGRMMALMDAPSVARAGYRGLMKGRRRVVPGLLNRCGVIATRFLPRALLLRLVHRLNR